MFKHLEYEGRKDGIVVHHHCPSASETFQDLDAGLSGSSNMEHLFCAPGAHNEWKMARGVGQSGNERGQQWQNETHPEMPMTMAGWKAPSLMIIQFCCVARSKASSRASWLLIGRPVNLNRLITGLMALS
eukprot:855527-Pelagomonas_calceolata.AAC.1